MRNNPSRETEPLYCRGKYITNKDISSSYCLIDAYISHISILYKLHLIITGQQHCSENFYTPSRTAINPFNYQECSINPAVSTLPGVSRTAVNPLLIADNDQKPLSIQKATHRSLTPLFRIDEKPFRLLRFLNGCTACLPASLPLDGKGNGESYHDAYLGPSPPSINENEESCYDSYRGSYRESLPTPSP